MSNVNVSELNRSSATCIQIVSNVFFPITPNLTCIIERSSKNLSHRNIFKSPQISAIFPFPPTNKQTPSPLKNAGWRCSSAMCWWGVSSDWIWRWRNSLSLWTTQSGWSWSQGGWFLARMVFVGRFVFGNVFFGKGYMKFIIVQVWSGGWKSSCFFVNKNLLYLEMRIYKERPFKLQHESWKKLIFMIPSGKLT